MNVSVASSMYVPECNVMQKALDLPPISLELSKWLWSKFLN